MIHVHVITVLRAESITAKFQGNASTYLRYTGHFIHGFVKCLFRDTRQFLLKWVHICRESKNNVGAFFKTWCM